MSHIISVYQYNKTTLAFSRRYDFPVKSADEVLNLSPTATLIPIPNIALGAGEEFYWTGDNWGVRKREIFEFVIDTTPPLAPLLSDEKI
jgi:hypothetical protein